MDTITETHGRKLATIQKISKLSPIENSDFLEVAEMENSISGCSCRICPTTVLLPDPEGAEKIRTFSFIP